MSLKHAILAALLDGESSGYELAKRFDASVANFWAATPQQLYRELERLEADGLVSARIVQQERRPNKRVFCLNAAGRQALAAFTGTTARPTAVRDELLVQVQAVDHGDPTAVRAAVQQRLELARDKIAGFERIRDRLLAGRSEEQFLDNADRVGPYMTLSRGIAFETENVRWAQWALRVLDGRTRHA